VSLVRRDQVPSNPPESWKFRSVLLSPQHLAAAFWWHSDLCSSFVEGEPLFLADLHSHRCVVHQSPSPVPQGRDGAEAQLNIELVKIVKTQNTLTNTQNLIPTICTRKFALSIKRKRNEFNFSIVLPTMSLIDKKNHSNHYTLQRTFIRS
jgi:hypothetical protein